MQVSEIIDEMSNMLEDDGGANYIQLHQSLNIVSEVTSAILGVLITVILIGIPLMVALEVCFINLPIFRFKVNNLASKNSKYKKLIGVTFRDAVLALERADCINTGQTVNMVYLQIKLKTIIIASVVVCLILGLDDVIIRLLISFVEKIIEVAS